MIELTEKQCQAVRNGEPVRLSLPEVGSDVVLLQADQYERIRELLNDEKEKAAWGTVCLFATVEAAGVLHGETGPLAPCLTASASHPATSRLTCTG